MKVSTGKSLGSESSGGGQGVFMEGLPASKINTY